ncbi:MAG TPA: hypothetical protein VIK48_00510, partial [Candidatus Manganitrophaceae bacterium]
LSWTPRASNLPGSGSVLSMMIVPGAPPALFAGSFQNGIFKLPMDDASLSASAWTPASADLSDKSVFALAVHPQLSSVLFAGTSNGVYKSGDAGANWTLSGLENIDVHFIAFDSTTAANPALYAGTSAGVYKSVDLAAAWTHLDDGMTAPVFSILADPTQNNIIYAGTIVSGVYKRTD